MACLPLLFFSGTPGEALRVSSFVSAAFAATAAFFLLTGSLFPSRLRISALVLWVAVAAQLLYRTTDLHPCAFVSVYLLLPEKLFDPDGRRGAVRQTLIRALFFPAVFTALGAFREVLGDRLLFWTFRLPAGAFLLLAAAAFLWKNQPGRLPERPAVKKGDLHA